MGEDFIIIFVPVNKREEEEEKGRYF